jgi:hypothetical protein
MKHLSLRQIQTVASSLISPTGRDVPPGVEETTSSRALVPLRRSGHGLSTLASISTRWLRPLDQARRHLVSAGFVEDVLRPVGSGFVQALLLHALLPSTVQAPASPRGTLGTWLQGQLARRAASNQGEPASNAQVQPPARSHPPADAAQWRYLHVEVHTWTTGDATDAMTVDIVAVQSVTHDTARTK